MLACFIRNHFILLGAIYIFFKLLNITPNSKHTQIILCFFSTIVSLCTAILFIANQSLNWIVILLLFFFMLKSVTKINLYTLYAAALFSFALSFIALSFSGIIASLILSLFCFGNYEIPWPLIRLLGGTIYSFLLHHCFRIPRLQKGMTFLYNIPSSNIGSTLCLFLFMVVLMIGQTKNTVETFMLSFSSFTLILTLLLLYWWNYHLTQTYKKYLRRNELASLEMLLSEKDAEITYYRNEHEKLSRLVHKDNKMIPALTLAVSDFLENADKLPSQELKLIGFSLQTQLNDLYDDRLTLLSNYERELLPLPSTGFSSVNGVLMFMQQKALQAGIKFQFLLSDNPSGIIPDMIPEKDFSHLLSDLLDNAIIAANSSLSGMVRIHMGLFDDIYTLKIFNTGNAFPVEVLQDIGITRHTSHEDTGGSGIGMMDIWKLKETYSATLLIDEITDAHNAVPSTTVNILFNRKNHYIIQTDRYKELIKILNRPDLLILSKE